MLKTLSSLRKQEKEKYKVPRRVQDLIPIRRIWEDGIFQVGSQFSCTWKFSDINYQVASLEDKKVMFLDYSELLNSLDSGSTAKITTNNRALNRASFEQSVLMPMQSDRRDEYRREYNGVIMSKATTGNGIVQEKYLTITVPKKNIEEAVPTLPGSGQTWPPIMRRWVPNAWSWTRPSACVSFMTFTVRARRRISTLVSGI